MKFTTATTLRKELFGVLERAARSIPTRIRYKKGDAVLLSYSQYEAIKRNKRRPKNPKKLQPLLSGKIRKPLNQKAEEELMQYMGL